MYDTPTAAVELISKTAKTVKFYRPEREDNGPVTRKADWLLVDGLTREQAEAFVERDRSSAALSAQEIGASKQRHAERRQKLLANMKDSI